MNSWKRNSLTASLLTVLALAPSAALAGSFIFTGSLQTEVIDTTGTYLISASGAQGGSRINAATGGLGAVISGEYMLTAGMTVNVIVGGQGLNSGGFSGGGGGGSFLYFSGGPLLLVAGGGGGGTYLGPNGTGGDGQTTNSGQDGLGNRSGSGGSGGSGGVGPFHSESGGGGGGWLSDGTNGTSRKIGLGGMGPSTFAGGLGYFGDDGGFGGGGGGGASGGGGGGGYSGGGGGDGGNGYAGGGGGSYLDGAFTNITLTGGGNAGDGVVSFTLVPDAVVVPEPSSLVMCGMASLIGAGYTWRRRRRRNA